MIADFSKRFDIKSLIKSLLFILFIALTISLYAQTPEKKNTVYYLVDTAKVPVNDRMFLVGQEGNLYGYRLTCECDPYKEDPYFVRYAADKGQMISKRQLKNIKLITLRQLIHLAVKYSVDKVPKSIFYFIEVQNKQLHMYNVRFIISEQPKNGY